MKKTIFLLVALSAPAAEAAYRCVDEKGVTHIGDRPPAACNKVPVFEVSPSGTVLRRIEPTLSPEEAKAREEAEAKRKEEEKAAAEQKRRDLALLSTYSTEKEFEIARDRNIEPLKARIRQLTERGKAVDERIKKIGEEMEFYQAGKGKAAKAPKDAKESKESKGREVPKALLADMERAKAEKASLARSIVNSEKEIEEIGAKFEADRKRWLALKSPKGGKPAEEPAEAAKGAAKKDAKGAAR